MKEVSTKYRWAARKKWRCRSYDESVFHIQRRAFYHEHILQQSAAQISIVSHDIGSEISSAEQPTTTKITEANGSVAMRPTVLAKYYMR